MTPNDMRLNRQAAVLATRPSAAQTSGHAGKGGLQRHSLGDLYPFVSIKSEAPDRPAYWVLHDTRTDFELTGMPTRELLDNIATICKAEGYYLTGNQNWLDFVLQHIG